MRIAEFINHVGCVDLETNETVEMDIQQEGRMVYFNVDGITAVRVSVAPGTLILLKDQGRGKHAGYSRRAKRD